MREPKRERPRWGFVVLILVLAAHLCRPGHLADGPSAEKEALIARIADRAEQPPEPLPPVAEWVGFDPEVWDFRHTSVTGTFRNDQTILVFTTLSRAARHAGRPGLLGRRRRWC